MLQLDRAFFTVSSWVKKVCVTQNDGRDGVVGDGNVFKLDSRQNRDQSFSIRPEHTGRRVAVYFPPLKPN